MQDFKPLLATLRTASAWVVLATLGIPSVSGQQIKNKELFGKSLEAAYQALDHFGALDDPEELERVNRIGYQVVEASGYTDFPLTFHLIDMPEPNAFALPGGQIFLTRGMLDLDLTDDMLAGLLGHEIAHVVKNHGTRIQKRAMLLNLLSQAAMVGVVVAANNDRRNGSNSRHPYDLYGIGPNSGSQNATLLQGAYAAGVVVSELLLRSYSREFEDESDEEGQRWAAAAGFDPNGTEKLMQRMNSRLPQSGLYGYWQTHPFFEERVRSAQVRRKLLTQLEPKSPDTVRQQTQKVLLEYVENAEEEHVDLLEYQSLATWPQGEAADAIRLSQLHERKDAELAKPALSQDFGSLSQEYREVSETVRQLTPESPLLAKLDREAAEFEAQIDQLYPKAVQVLDGDVFERSFLETYLSNYPDAPNRTAVQVKLGEAYARLGRQTESVEQFLAAWEAAPESEAGKKAKRGLENLAPSLEKLGALQHLARIEGEPALRQLAAERLAKIVETYDDPANGADYLERFPIGDYVEAITERQNVLADNLYGEVILYQSVGENLKALERIQLILAYAPGSRAAERLRESVVLDS